MKNFEFNNWVEYTRSIYPDFRADSEGLPRGEPKRRAV